MRLDRIQVEGFKSIKSANIKLEPLNILIGANGAGKSNFISIFKLLNQMVEQNLQLYARQAGGANTFLYLGEHVTQEIKIRLDFDWNAYSCTLVPTADDSLVYADEVCYWHHRDRFPQPLEIPLGSGHKESNLPEEARRFPGKVADHVLTSIKSWIVYHFHDTSDSAKVKKISDINDNIYFRNDASNLAAFLYKLKNSSIGHYNLIRENIRMVAPFFDDFILRPMPENENKVRLEWKERGSDYPFLAYHLSDGTLRFICLATLLLQPELPSTILIDEPELGLHPYAINILASLMKSASKRAQIIVSTQSVTLVNQFRPDDLLIVDLKDRATIMERVNTQGLSEWIQTYALGELWERNMIGGRPS